MAQNIDLAFQEVLNDSTPDMDVPIPSSGKKKNDTAISQETEFSQAQLADLISNRIQREEFTKQIILIMCAEIAFIAVLILGVFFTSYINSLSPQITINFPPIFLTLSLIFVYVYLYKFCNSLPPIRITCRQINLKKHHFKIGACIKVLLTLLLVGLLNIFAREGHIISFKQIILTDNVIHMILYTALAVFIKTTILAGYIIHGLYRVLNNQSYSKK